MDAIIKTHDGKILPADFIKLFSFPGGEPHVSCEHPAALEESTVVLRTATGSWQELGELAVTVDFLRRVGVKQISLFSPYLPGARQDRGAPLTARVYADFINSLKFRKVIAVDPHSPVMPALLDNFIEIPAAQVVVGLPFFDNVTHIICPDAGAVKRTEEVAAALEKPVLYARKHRDFSTGKLSGFSCEDLPEDGVGAVVDDICDGGGTFIGLAEVINVAPRRLKLWTTHGIYSKGLSELNKYYSEILSTDSFRHTAPARSVRLQDNTYVQKVIDSVL